MIETVRLLLRPARPADGEAFETLMDIPEIWRWVERPPTSGRGMIETHVETGWPEAVPGNKATWFFNVEERQSGRMLGCIRLSVTDVPNCQGTLGFFVGPAVWGTGVAGEAVRAVVGWGFGTLGLERISADTDVENLPAQRLMERIGMRREGLMRHARKVRGVWRDWLLYAVLAGEFATA